MTTAATSDAQRRAFEGILGRDAVVTDPLDRARFEIDARQGRGRAAGVLLPRTTADVARAVGCGVRAGVHLVLQGANTGLVGAGVPDESGTHWVLSLDRLRAEPKIDAYGRTARAMAGVRLSELNARAGAHGLTFPIDLAADPSIGGMVAANTGGARFIRYGDVRRSVLALEVVLCNALGAVVELGAGVWKDNTGLDLKQLFIGSSGAMGIVTAATLALQPAPGRSTTALILIEDLGVLNELLRRIEISFGPLLSAFEGMSRNALAAALSHTPRLRNPFPDGAPPEYAALVEISDPLDQPDRIVEALADCLQPLMRPDAVRDVLVGDPTDLWALRHAIPEGLRASGQVIACDVCVARGDVAAFRAAAMREVTGRWPGLQVCDFGHVGDGGVHFNLTSLPDRGPLSSEAVEAVKSAVFRVVVEDFGGSFSAEHGIGPRNAAFYDLFKSAAVRELSGQVQRLVSAGAVGRVNFLDASEEGSCP